MSLPRQQPLQTGNIARPKHRRTSSSRMTMANNLFRIVTTLLVYLAVVANGQETDASLSLQRMISRDSLSLATIHNRRRLSSSSTKSKEASSSSNDEEGDKPNPSSVVVVVGAIESKSDIGLESAAAVSTDADEAAFPVQELAVKPFNVTAISFTTCVKIEYAVSYLTSLDWKDIDIGENNNNEKGNKKKIWMEVYLFELVLLPASLAMVFFGSQLLLPVCTTTAAGLGVFCIFHFVNNYFRGGLDCPMKLALSGVSATLAAMGAAAFVRFGLFTLGTVSAGGLSYLFFDAFPDLDPGLNATVTASKTAGKVAETLASDISPHAWVITILIALAGGLFLRQYEQASLEVLTAILGGVGVSYSVHAFLLSQHVDLDRSVVFLIASMVTMFGSRFQRKRRLRLTCLQSNPYHDYKGQLPVYWELPPPPPVVQRPMVSPVRANNPNLSLNNWNQLKDSLCSTNHLLQQQRQNDANVNANEMETMAKELTNLLNSFQERIQKQDRSKKQ